jgi:hypothetical protein
MVSPPIVTPLSVLLAVLVFAAIIFIARWSRRWTVFPADASRRLTSRWAPLAAGIATVALVRIVWGSFSEPGVVHDERAYLLQAEIFARGQWTAPAPPIADFFEQMHVFIEPAVFAKYPPAHALTLVPGVWLGVPGLMPALLTGLAGALIFWIARRLSNEWIALLTWWLWTTAWPTLHWSASYFSQTTSTAMWLLAVWGTIRWLDTGPGPPKPGAKAARGGYLSCVAAALAWGLLARPLTTAVLTLPLAFVIVRRLIAVRRWKPLAAPVLVGAGILALAPVWNQQTLGDWRRDPYPYYSKVYFPFDKPGLGVDPSPPLRHVPPELASVGEWSRDLHQRHVRGGLPSALVIRLIAVLFWCVEGWRLTLGALAVASVLHGSAVDRFAVIPLGMLFLAYLTFAHPPMWTVYYLEVLPIFYYLAARELGRLIHKFSGSGAEMPGRWSAAVANASLATAILLLPFGVSDVLRVRSAVDRRNSFHRTARNALTALPQEKSIVFVSYPADHIHHRALTRNEPDLASAERWLVYDRGTRNAELLSLAPDRKAYRLDVRTFRVVPLPDE